MKRSSLWNMRFFFAAGGPSVTVMVCACKLESELEEERRDVLGEGLLLVPRVGYGSWREEEEKEEDGKEEDGMTVCWTGKLPLASAPLLL